MKYEVTLKGKVYEVVVERGEAILVDERAASLPVVSAPVINTPAVAASAAPAAVTLSGEVVSAPLPGVVVNVGVNVGDKVKSGQTIMIIEAMKMENEISAPRDGTVSQIAVQKGSKVETGTPLLSLA